MKVETTIWLSIRISSFALVTLLLSPLQSTAQGLYNNATLYIDGTSVYVDGDVVSAGSLDNEGLLAFTRDWDSAGKYKGKGVLIANGNTPQKIQHYDQSVNTLVIDGWGTKYVRGILTVTDKIRLTNGVVEVASGDILKLQRGAIAEGGSTDSYVDGALTVEGNGYQYFPIGKNGNYAPIEFLNVLGKAPEFSMEVFDNAPTLSVEDVIVRRGLYWQRKDIKGGFGGSAVAVHFERSYFQDPEKITLVTGYNFKEPFTTLQDLDHSTETDKISTRSEVIAPIIMIGEISDRWTEADFYFSTAMSPNASRAENHQVKIFGDRLADDEFRFQVFNRWGALVFESTSLEVMKREGWDGRTAQGTGLASGAYPYRLTAIDKTGTKFEKTGVITIIH